MRVAPWTITTGTLPSPPCGTMYRMHLVDGDVPPGRGRPVHPCDSTLSPPTKLPWAFSTSGVSRVCTSLRACAMALTAVPSTTARAAPTQIDDRHNFKVAHCSRAFSVEPNVLRAHS